MIWHVYHRGEPIRCPAIVQGRAGRRCNRAQDKVGELVTVSVRVASGQVSGIERRCRSCGTTLEIIERWRGQIATPYADLTEAEKDADRYWADRILAITEDKGEPVAWGLRDAGKPVGNRDPATTRRPSSWRCWDEVFRSRPASRPASKSSQSRPASSAFGP